PPRPTERAAPALHPARHASRRRGFPHQPASFPPPRLALVRTSHPGLDCARPARMSDRHHRPPFPQPRLRSVYPAYFFLVYDSSFIDTISYPEIIARKLFHPALMTCATCTTKNSTYPAVNQKCSKRAIS